MLIELVCATRYSPDDFWTQSALGQSLSRIGPDSRYTLSLACDNLEGLPQIYNNRINAQSASTAFLFVHDDVWLEDYFLANRLSDAFERFDVVGVAGSRRRLAKQPSWCFADTSFVRQPPEQLSGAVAHGRTALANVLRYGDVPAPCELLDGVLLAVNRGPLNAAGVSFDLRFAFHFYDMDFCRSAHAAGLRLGTWPISLTHQSTGVLGSAPWREAYAAYLTKWGD